MHRPARRTHHRGAHIVYIPRASPSCSGDVVPHVATGEQGARPATTAALRRVGDGGEAGSPGGAPQVRRVRDIVGVAHRHCCGRRVARPVVWSVAGADSDATASRGAVKGPRAVAKHAHATAASAVRTSLGVCLLHRAMAQRSRVVCVFHFGEMLVKT